MSTTQTKTVYRLMYQHVATGQLCEDPERRGPDCATPALAKRAHLTPAPGEQVVLVAVDARLGGDGAWHPTATTIVEVL